MPFSKLQTLPFFGPGKKLWIIVSKIGKTHFLWLSFLLDFKVTNFLIEFILKLILLNTWIPKISNLCSWITRSFEAYLWYLMHFYWVTKYTSFFNLLLIYTIIPLLIEKLVFFFLPKNDSQNMEIFFMSILIKMCQTSRLNFK